MSVKNPQAMDFPQVEVSPLLIDCLTHLYSKPASVTLITQDRMGWKWGKTDLFLYLTEALRQLGIIDIFGANIETENSYLDYVDNFSDFDYWVFQNRHRKAFGYDEALGSSPKRRAMSRINVEWLMRIAQLSKGKCHLFVITQAEQLSDTIFKNPIFLRAIWSKMNLTSVRLNIIGKRETFKFLDVPRTQLKFDPFLQATWKTHSEKPFDKMPLPYKVLAMYGNDMSLEKIKNELGFKHKTEVMRLLRTACKAVTKLQDTVGGLSTLKE